MHLEVKFNVIIILADSTAQIIAFQIKSYAKGYNS